MNSLNNNENSLEVKKLYKYFGNFCAIKNLTFCIRKAECLGLLGIFFNIKIKINS